MSSENFAVILAGFRCFEARDLDGFRRLVSPDVTATAFEDWPEPGPWTDPDALIHQLERISTDWSDHRIVDPELVAEEGEWVIVQYRWEVEGGTSGIETMTLDLVGAFRVRNGLMVELHWRRNLDAALEAAGLSE